MRFFYMDGVGVGHELDLPSDLVVGTLSGSKVARDVELAELCWQLQGELVGEKLVRDTNAYLDSWRKPEWAIYEKPKSVDRYARQPISAREKADEIIRQLKFAELSHFRCTAPGGMVALSTEWDGKTVRMRPGPGFPQTAEQLLILCISLDFGVDAEIHTVMWKPEMSDKVAGLVAPFALYEHYWVEFHCENPAEQLRVFREVRKELRKFVKTVKCYPIGPPQIYDWSITAPTTRESVPELLREQVFTKPAQSLVTGSWKPAWDESLAVPVNGELCIVVGERAWTQYICKDAMKSAPSFTRLGDAWVAVQAPSPKDAAKMVPDRMKELEKAVRA